MLERARDSVLYVKAYREKLKLGEYYMDKGLKVCDNLLIEQYFGLSSKERLVGY